MILFHRSSGGLEDCCLLPGHPAVRTRLQVIMPGEVEKAMDAIQGELGSDIVAELPGTRFRDIGTDKNLAVRKCEDVGCTPDVEKLPVEPRHRAAADHCALDVLEPDERSAQL